MKYSEFKTALCKRKYHRQFKFFYQAASFIYLNLFKKGLNINILTYFK